MEQIIEVYGSCILQMLGGVGALAIYRAFFVVDGVMYQILQQYMVSICG